MKTTELKTCYMCDKPATSREHAPPKCLFPKAKNAFNGKDLRVQMIVVPSCDEHNCDKSSDDEYLMQILPMSIGLNEVADHYFQSKVSNLVKSNKKFVKSLNDSAVPVVVQDLETGVWSRTMAFKIDLPRILSVLEMNARAIYFHHRGKKLSLPFRTLTNFSLIVGSASVNDNVNEAFLQADSLLTEVGVESQGSNPEVFSYKIDRQENVELIEFTFYGSSKAIFVIDHSAKPA